MRPDALKIGVIGTGFGRTVQIPGFQEHPETEVVAVCSRHLERAQATAREFGIEHAVDDYRDMLDLPELDVVSITTPPDLHHEMTLAALDAGTHVLCEKPMALTVAEAEEMTRAARDAGLVGMIDHEFRFIPARARSKELIDAGYLGDLRSVTINWISDFMNDRRPWDWSSIKAKGHGALEAVGSHAFDLLFWWFGDIASCLATGHTQLTERRLPDSEETRPVDIEDWLVTAIKFEHGGRGVVHINTVAWHNTGVAIEIHGSAGTLVIDKSGTLYGAQHDDPDLAAVEIPQRLYAAPGAGPDSRIDFLWLVEQLVRAVRDGKEPHPTFADGLRCQRVLAAAEESLQQNCWVALV